MNFKIENNYINISNYPSIEKHFEEMASKGWLINKIITGNLFFYKKILPEELDFSISPYEVETAFTRKSKKELEEFQTVCESVGWNYATKTYDLHIYYKEKGSEAVAIETDEEEEFKTLELIGKKQLKAQYWQVPFFLFLAWLTIGRSLASVYGMRDGLTQIAALMIPLAIILGVLNIIELRRFLKINKKNIDMGKNIEFNDSKYLSYKICFSIFNIIIIGFIIYLLYSAIVLRNKIMMMGFIPVLIGTIIGTLYRIFIKPSKKSKDYKKVAFVITILVGSIVFTPLLMLNIESLTSHESKVNIEVYRVLTLNDFTDKDIKEDGNLRRNVSMLIPESYEYSSYARGQGVINTEYSNALSENLAETLVRRYKNEAENRIIGRKLQGLKFMFENDIYDSYLERSGLTEDDFNSLKDKDKKQAIDEALEIIKQKSIIEDKDGIWNMDEVYFLNIDKYEIVIRNGKEVFFLGGLDFSDPEVVKVVKDRLELY